MNNPYGQEKRGLFVNGIWHCDCDTRLPAEKFQCKNGGKNHGRWFYTCQKSSPSRCSFFMFASNETEARERAALMSNNNNTEPGHVEAPKVGFGGRLRSMPAPPKTPKRQTKLTDALTPITKTPLAKRASTPQSSWDLGADMEWASSNLGITATQPLSPVAEKAPAGRRSAIPKSSWDLDDLEWASSDLGIAATQPLSPTATKATSVKRAMSPMSSWDLGNDLEWASSNLGIAATQQMSPTPQRPLAEAPTQETARSSEGASSAKRQKVTAHLPAKETHNLIVARDDLPRTPQKSHQPEASGLPSPAQTPDVRRRLFAAAAYTQRESSPVDDVLPLVDRVWYLLKPVIDELPDENYVELQDLLEKYELKACGFEKGRNATRHVLYVRNRELEQAQEENARLLEENRRLLAEKVVDQKTIHTLKLDAATSPKPYQRPRRPPKPLPGVLYFGD